MKKKEVISNELEALLDEKRPELDDEWFAEADVFVGDRLVRRGRPPSENPKRAISLRVDADVLDHYRSGGPGWQSRMNNDCARRQGSSTLNFLNFARVLHLSPRIAI